MPLASLLFPSCLLPDSLFWLADLSQGRKGIVVLRNVSIENVAIDFGCFQRRVSHELLEGKRIAPTIHQILTGEGMTEKMNTCLLDAAPLVIGSNRQAQHIFREHTAILIAKEIIFLRAASDLHVVLQDGHHEATQGNDLYLSNLCVRRMICRACKSTSRF